MVRLFILDQGHRSQAILLTEGTHRFGRNLGNDHAIEDPTVSGAHCEIVVGPDGARVRDLGSTNGTFVESVQVQGGEVALEPGQRLRLGNVEFEYPALTVAAAVPEAAPPVYARPATPVTRPGGRVMAPPRPERAAGSFFSRVGESFSYPLKRGGVLFLICGAVFFALLDFAQMILIRMRVGFFGFAYLIALVFSTGYLFEFLQSVIQTSANGEDRMPGWPDVSGFGDLMGSAFRLTALMLVCFGPGFALTFFAPGLGLALMLLGAFCLPMALLTVAMADSLGGLNPIVIFSSIAKLPLAYGLTCVIFLVATAALVLTDRAMEFTGIPLIPTLVGTFVSLYLMTVEMRVLGLLYYTHQEKLAWFD